ncbi:MAG: alginate export family protein, partial [Ignavibacteria bacterium]|nr:alginate export family protein [Ignavibacteria bacterium]
MIRPWYRSGLFLFAGILLFMNGATANDSLVTWKAEMRVRGEADGRDFMNSTSPNLYTLLRTRFGADVRPVEDLTISVLFQDSRIFGQPVVAGAGNTTTNLRNIDLHEGYIRVDNLFARHLSLTVGRMGLSYGAERIIGRLDWSNVGRTFDGALIRFAPSGHALDLWANSVTEYSVPPSTVTRATVASRGNEGYLFWGGHYSYLGISGHKFALLGFQERSYLDTTTGEIDRSRWTLGGRADGSLWSFFYEAEGAYQLGSESGADISAYLLAASLGYRIDSPLRSVMAGYEHLSGTPAGSAEIKTFQPPFPTAHKFLGIMDYFTNIRLQTFDRGLRDLYLRIVLV